ncbi:YadA-like family protein [uncultured Dialister sp.]|jgi:hypothetical protein|uniref:YadA-like family protein n=3 Tax=uncultured Dialister sp. TaxID=278064 RepID=UPI0025CF2221|nr:YadA-like family protein [uncultured Dialister sp.]
MKLAGKKLTAAVLAGLMSVAMVGGAQAANQIKTVESSGSGSRASLSLHSDGRAVLEAVKGNPDKEQRGFFDASVTTATVGTTSGRDATQNHGTLSTGVGSVTISAALDGKTSKVKTTAAGGTEFSNAADSHGQTTTIKGGNIKTNEIDANSTITGGSVTSRTYLSADKGVVDRSTEDSTVVKKANTVGQNLNALDERVSNVKDSLQDNIDKEAAARQDGDNQLNQKMTLGFADIQEQQDEQDAKIAKNAKDIQTNAGNIKTNADNIKANSDKLANHEERIASNEQNIETNAESIKKETNDRIDADKTLQDNIDKEAAARQDGDNQLNQKMTLGFADIQEQQDEQDAKIAKNAKDIQTNAGNIKTNADNIKANSDKLANHEERIASNEQNIETNAESIKKETNDRIDADKTLQDQITNTNNVIGSTSNGHYVKSDNSVGENLNALDAQVGQNSSNIDQLFNDYSSMKKDLNKVGARSAALAGLHAVDYDPSNKLSFAVASGNFRNANSVAVGAFYRPNANIMFSAASTMGDSDNAYTFGVSFKLGPSTAKAKTAAPDTTELYKVIGQLQDQLAAQQKEIDQLKADKAK